ncbi:MAG: uracil-DNA glycosylase [Alphaproteobacteria bacterium]|nr:uracil-DNA glycosylase [Alphaproteobacteria bacterium]
MSRKELQDLILAGVNWELTDTPSVVQQAPATIRGTAPTFKTDTPVTPELALATSGRTPTSIVPPIAPIAPISNTTAQSMAARPTDIPSLLRMIGQFSHPLRAGATNTVLPHIGTNQSGLLIITDIPSTDDDETGNILSGNCGELLDKMIGAIGIDRSNVSISPLVFWRTPGGRTPSRDELDLTRPFINRIIELLTPTVILTLGTLAATEICNSNLPKDHGIIKDMENGTKCIPIFHPNYLMLKPTAKRDAWTALQQVQILLKNPEK